MTEQELVQTALANLPRPAPPPRLRRAVMAQVRQEAAVQVQTCLVQTCLVQTCLVQTCLVQTWSRTASDGWTTERWEGTGGTADTAPAPTPAHVTRTHWRQEDAGRTTIYQLTQTY